MEQPVFHSDCRVEVTKDNINNEEFFKILKHLKPTWNSNDLICKDLSGGYLNLILRCYMKSNPDDSVVFRIWSKNTADLFEGFFNRKTETQLLHKLGEKGVAPKLYASFTNGVCYEYFEGEKLSAELCKTDKTAKSVARNFAKIHGTRIESFCPEQEIFQRMKSVCKALPNQLKAPEENKNVQTRCLSKEQIEEEIKFLEEYVNELNCPLVQCHGDPHPQNMMYNKETGKVIFLDYEIAHTGHQPADLASFFLALTLDFNDTSKGFQARLLPPESYQRKFLRWYLEEWFETTGRNADEITEDDENKLFTQVSKYFLMTFFYFGMVFCRFYGMENKDEMHEDLKKMDWLKLGMEHFEDYFEKKELCLSLKDTE